MTICRLLQIVRFAPEEIGTLVTAYRRTLKALWLVDRNDPVTEIVARKIIEVAQRGMRDPMNISELAIEELRKT